MKLFVLLFSLSLVSVPTLLAVDEFWLGWLGEDQSGRLEGFRSPSPWPGDLKVKWRVQVGPGYVSPVVAEGRILVHSRHGEQEMVRALRMDSGKVIWAKNHPVPFKIGGGGERHGKGPKANPCYSAGLFFTTSISGILTA